MIPVSCSVLGVCARSDGSLSRYIGLNQINVDIPQGRSPGALSTAAETSSVGLRDVCGSSRAVALFAPMRHINVRPCVLGYRSRA